MSILCKILVLIVSSAVACYALMEDSPEESSDIMLDLDDIEDSHFDHINIKSSKETEFYS